MPSLPLQYSCLPASCRHLIPRPLRRLMVGQRCADCGQPVLAHREMLEAIREACRREGQAMRLVCEVCSERNMQEADEVRCYVPDTRPLEKYFRQT